MEKILLYRQLGVMLQSGVPIVRALEIMAPGAQGEKGRSSWREVGCSVYQGQGLYQAMSQRLDYFTLLELGLIRAGEVACALAESCHYLADFFAWEQRLRQRLWAALHYPLIVSVVMALLIGALARYILPVFTPFLEGQRSHLPWCSRLFLELLTLCNGPLWIVLSLLGGLGAAWAYYLYIYHPQGRYQLQHLILTIPLLGEAVRHLVLSRFCRTLALLLNSGLSLERALPIVGGALAHHPLALALEGVEAELKEGSELEGALRAEEFSAHQGALVGALRVVQATGRLPTILEDWSRLLAQRGELQLETLSQLLEPLLVAFLGGVMGFILVSLFAPLYSLLSQGLS